MFSTINIPKIQNCGNYLWQVHSGFMTENVWFSAKSVVESSDYQSQWPVQFPNKVLKLFYLYLECILHDQLVKCGAA